MKKSIRAAALALAILTCGNLLLMADDTNPKKGNDKAPLGSPDFRPSPDRPIGWRGDGSGHFPGANPPVHWGRVAKSVKGLRSQATKPKEGETGKPIDGSIREWLILGPVPVPDELVKLDKDVLPDEAKMEPDEGDKAGNITWKKITPGNQTLDLRALLGVTNQIQAVAYACSYVYSESAQDFHMSVMSSGHRLYINGAIPKKVSLQKGWNRFLFRVQCGKNAGDWRNKAPEFGAGPDPKWYLRNVLYGVGKSECETENIAWNTDLPGYGISAPVIVGDKVFLTSERRSIVCLNKNDGKLLWMRTITLFDVATEDEKKACPEVFQEIAPLAAKLSELDRSIKPGTPVSNEFTSAKQNIEDKIINLMLKVDRKKYALYPAGEGGVSAPTPASDGQNIYATFLPYLVACFDMEGNRQWVKMHEMVPPYAGQESHGMYSSPLLMDGKLICSSDSLVALDAKSGKPAWQTNDAGYFASLVPATLENEPLIVTRSSVIRARDGKRLSSLKLGGGGSPTPVIGDGKIFRPGTGADEMMEMFMMLLPASPAEPFKVEAMKSVPIDTRRFPKWYVGTYSASPLYHEGIFYCLSEDGVLSAVDTEKREVAYQELLDLDLEMGHRWEPAARNAQRGGAGSSPALAGKYIYVFGNHGACVVIEPGRTFRQVARNRIENGVSPDVFTSCPVFEGKRLYYRTVGNLYCIEEK